MNSRGRRAAGAGDKGSKGKKAVLYGGIGVLIAVVLVFQFMKSSMAVGRNWDKVREGMTGPEVITLMGEPDEKTGDVLLWHASSKGVVIGTKGVKRSKRTSHTTFAVILKDGNVAEKIQKPVYLHIEDVGR